MSGVLKTISKIAGIVATIAPFFGPVGVAVAAVATVISLVTGIAGKILEKKPPPRGSISSIIVSSDGPMSCIIGRSYAGGQLVHDVGYGPTIKDVPNPYRAMAIVYSIGLCASLEGVYADFTPVNFSGTAATGYYSGFLYRDFKLGAIPESVALTNPVSWGAIPNWGASHKLSGKAAILYSMKFDRDGKVFAAGVPQLGAVWQGVPCYDPRKDSTYPGGLGSHRWVPPADRAAHDAARATWEYSENPGLHGLHYALGRYQRDTDVALSNYQKVIGIGMPISGIEVSQYVAFANICDANNWKVGGTLFEPGEGVRWNNLKDILAAGGGEPSFVGGRLGVVFDAPGVAVDTITSADLAEDDSSVTGQGSYRTRLNGVIPKFRSEAHKWEYVPSEIVTVPAWVAADGEERTEQIQWNMVQSRDQAAQLAAYDLYNRRELGDIQLVCKPRLRRYGPGTRLTVNIPELGLINQLCEIRNRTIDPGTLKVSLILRSETTAKHAFALGKTGTAPPPPTLTAPSAQDDIASILNNNIDFASIIGTTKPEANATRNENRGIHDLGAVYVRGDEVSNSTNTSLYKAKQAVPAVTALTNSAYWQLVIVSSGGAAGDNAFQFTVDPAVVSVATDSAGAGGAYPKTVQLTMREGATDRTVSSTFAIVSPVPSWVSVNAAGLVTITDPSGPDKRVQFDGTYGSNVFRVTLQVLQQRAGIAGADGSGALLDGSFESGGFTYWTPIGAGSTIVLGAGLDGSNALRVAVGSPAAPYGLSNKWSVQSGQIWNCSGWALRDASSTPSVNSLLLAIFLNPAGAQIANATIGVFVPSSTGWQQGLADITVPAGASFMALDFGEAIGVGGHYLFSRAAVSLKGAQGAAGFTHAEKTVFRQSATLPATPSGGSYNFATKVLTPPSGWTEDASGFSGSDPVYLVKQTATIQGSVGTAALGTWSSPGVAFRNGTDGGVGADGQSIDIVYQRSATQPATPAPSAGVPSTWYGDPASVPASASPMWQSVGERPTLPSNYMWQLPLRSEGIDGADGSPGTPGVPGAPGNKTVRVFGRFATAPATPTGNVPPSGWTLAVPAADGNPAFASEVETLADGITAVGTYTAPVVFEAVAPTATSQSTTYNGILTKALSAGQSLSADAAVSLAALTGGGATYTLTLQIREAGGTFAPFGTAGVETGAISEPLQLMTSGSFVNSTGQPRIYEISTTLTKTGSGTGVVRNNASYLRA